MRVVVAGGGTSGFMAALAAARSGAEVTLIERGGFLGGGTGTVGANYIGGWCALGTGEQVVKGGLPGEFVERLVDAGATMGYYRYDETMCDVPVNAELCKFVMDEMIVAAGVQPLFHTFVVGAEVDDNGALKKAVIANKAGISEVDGDAFVDATGDADLAFFAGAPCDMAPLDELQKATLMFKMGGVDFDGIRAYAKEYPGQVGDAPQDGMWAFGFRKLLAQAVEDARSRGEEPPFVRGPLIALSALNPGEYWLLMTDVSVEGTDPRELSRLEVEARRQIKGLLPVLREYIPGFEKAYLSQIAPRSAVRETRRIVGEYVLTKEDVVQGREFPDVVCRLCHHIDLHDNALQGHRTMRIESPRARYDLPYRCLVPKTVDNLLVSGRCVSVTSEALGSVRIQSHCLATGQAAGMAAAMSAAEQVSPRELNVQDLQARLAESGALSL